MSAATGPLIADRILSNDRGPLMAQLAELASVLTDPEAVEIGSLFSALARAHGMGWGKKATH